jgi:hypothetical protein
MVDIDNLKDLDPSTKGELLAEVRKSYGALARLIETQKVAQEQEKLTDPFAFLEKHFGRNADIFRLIITHPDMDHMTGIKRLVSERDILNFWHSGPDDFNLERWKEGPYDQDDWDKYQELRDSKSSPKAHVKRTGDTGPYWTEDGIEVWAPTDEAYDRAVELEEANVASTVLKISYLGQTIVLGGDAMAQESWPSILETVDVGHIEVLKASHHGRETGYYKQAVKAMSPWLTITSVVGESDATDKYRRYSDYTVSLRDSRDITLTIADDGTLYYPPSLEAMWKPKA